MNFYNENENSFWETPENNEPATSETTGNKATQQHSISREMKEQQTSPFNFEWPPNSWRQEVPTIKEMSDAIRQRFSFPMAVQQVPFIGAPTSIGQATQQYKYGAQQQTYVIPNDNTKVSKPFIPPLREKRTLSGNFDGNRFTIKGRTPNMIYSESYPAVSGKPDETGSFDYSTERQKTPNVGPIPEGTYWINPQKIMKYDDTSLLNKALSYIKKGSFPGGENSWGKGKIEINPNQVILDNNIQRGNFTIHGGKNPGSRGCIDLTKYDERLFNFLENYRGDQDSIPIFVKYPQKNTE